MLKLKGPALLTPNNGKLRSFSASLAYSATETIPRLYQDQATSYDPHVDGKSKLSDFSDPKFYVSALLNCKDVYGIRQVHTLMAVSGMLQNLYVANKLLYIYSYHRAVGDAHAFFGTMVYKNMVSWSVMVGGFAKAGDYLNCIATFRRLIRSGTQPDNYTLPMVIRACRDALDLHMGSVVQNVAWKNGLNLDRFVCAALVEMYARCGAHKDARYLFDEMPERDLVIWTVMIGALAESGRPSESLDLFDRMRGEGIIPDKIAMVNVVHACTKFGALNKAKEVHLYINAKNIARNVILDTAMIDMYAKCGCINSAKEIFENMKGKNVISWSSMIAAYGYHGQGRKALDLFPVMLSSGIMPNKITFVSLLYACSHAGLVKDGIRIFSLMQGEYGLIPDVQHYTSMVDLLGRAGRFDEAMKLIENMTVDKDVGLWGALLGACRKHKNIDLAEIAAKSLLELRSENPGHYVLLSNIYAKAGQWKEVAKIRDLMTQRRLKKIPGWTWIEVADKIYRFGVGDVDHPRSQEIYMFLNNLYEKLELAGYVPDTDFVLHDVDEEVKVEILSKHSEKLAIAFGLLATPDGTSIHIMKNLRICGDCHAFIKFVSVITGRVIVVRDANRFHHFKEGDCSCGDYW